MRTMPLDVTRFAGIPPYASELFGIYQPLLGWHSNQGRLRADKERSALASLVVEGMIADPRVRAMVQVNSAAVSPSSALPARVPGWLTTSTARRVHDALAADASGAPQRRSSNLDLVLRALPAHGAAWGSAATAPLGDHVATFTTPPPATTSFDDQVRDAVSAGAIRYFSEHAPAVARALFSTNAARWEGIHRFVDPLGLFDPQTQQAILSPIGLLDVYREFFFELDTVLGPPVSHVWVSPGGTVELYEVHTTKKSEERTVETQTEVTVRSEQDTTTQDELSTSVNQDNGRSMNVGVSATGGVNFGVAQASASASFAMSQTHTTAAQTAHKHARQQSDKLSNEIRRSLKTTFKTTVENTDTSSRRYVLNNLTGHLVNYELRRKMRLVGVQLQHVGTQLCWQIYIDDPGAQLGVAELCHVAQPADLSALSPPELPVKPEVRAEDWQCEFYYDPLNGDPNPDSDYDMGAERHYILHRGHINYQQTYAPPVPTGYRLYNVNPLPSMTPEDPNKDPPEFDPQIETDPKTNTFTVTMRHVNFHGQAAISLNVSLVWQPVEDKQAKKDDVAQKAAAESSRLANRVLDQGKK